jgi:hypothetical protein
MIWLTQTLMTKFKDILPKPIQKRINLKEDLSTKFQIKMTLKKKTTMATSLLHHKK